MLYYRTLFSRHGSRARGPRWLPLFAGLLVLGFATSSVWAQVNTAGVRGSVKDADGKPVANAEVTLLHEPSSNIKTARTNASGAYAFNGLRVGGPYQVIVIVDGFVPQEITEIYLNAGKKQNVPVILQIAQEVITIRGEAPTPRTTSPRTVFGARDIEGLPALGRDPKDIARLTPEAYLEGDDQAMSIGGQNNRFNSVTIDGIRQNDDFGLNGNGYPTQRSPISLAAIEEIAVETSPFDVRYGNFLGGNVNIVTKSGTNEFHGSLLQTLSNDSLTGSRSGNDSLELDFNELRYGMTLGGPIIKDKVHFFVNVEGLNATTPVSVGPAGSGAANEVGAVSVADVERVQQIARDVYGFNAGVPSQSLDETDLKLLAKVDWAINQKHRLSAKYQRTNGNVINDGFFNDSRLPLTSSWYDRDDQLNAFSLRLFSDWSSQLSTEFEFNGKMVDTRQEPLSGSGFMAAEIETTDGGTIVLGPDVFRHANELDNQTLHFKAQANYLLGDHLITGGWEYDRLSVFNLFVPFSNGDVEYDSIDDFEAQSPSSIFYSNAISNNPDDGAADWGYGIHALYLQDQWDISSKLTAQGGVRMEIYQSGADVPENTNFFDRHGFTNTETVNGRFVAMPRLGVTYRPIRKLNLRGGAGLYAGGTPNVWISNNYSNNGISIDGEFSSDPDVIGGFDGYNIPQGMQDALVAGDGNVDALDPDFKIPSTWKIAAGLDYTIDIPGLGDAGKNLGIELNYTYSKVNNGIRWRDLRRDYGDIPNNLPVGTLPDGRSYYDKNDFDGDGETFNTRRGYDMLLTNTDKGHGHTLSLSLNKRLPGGLTLFGAYAYQNVKELSPATSSRSVSNYGQAAVGLDPNDPELGISNYQRKHRLIGAVRFSRALFAKLNTNISMFFERRSGQPYSYTFGGNRDDLAQLFGEEREFSRRNRQLFYVPNLNDPNVILDGIDEASFNQFLEDSGLDKYRGEIAPRNVFNSDWLSRVDLRFAQELVKEQGARLFIDIENFGNLLNSNWGRYEQVGFPYLVPVVDVDVDADGNYVYSNLRTDRPERVNVLRSVWRIQATLQFEF